jgi:hypothetical protein
MLIVGLCATPLPHLTKIPSNQKKYILVNQEKVQVAQYILVIQNQIQELDGAQKGLKIKVLRIASK